MPVKYAAHLIECLEVFDDVLDVGGLAVEVCRVLHRQASRESSIAEKQIEMSIGGSWYFRLCRLLTQT